MEHTFKLFDTRKYIANKIVGRISFSIVLILALLVIDRSLEGGLATTFGFSKAMIIVIWIALIVFIILSIYLGMIRYNIGEISISTKEIKINTIDQTIIIPTNQIKQLEVSTNKSRNKTNYGRSEMAGGKNFITWYYNGIEYKYELFLDSIKDDAALMEVMEMIEKDENMKINWA